MLNGTLNLHGVDVEHLCRQVRDDWCREQRKHNSHLSDDRRDDLLAYLIEIAWRISLRYDPTRGKPFRQYARSILLLRCTDWLRKDEGRTVWKFSDTIHVRERPKLVSLDTPERDPVGHPDGDTTRGHHTDSDPFEQRLPHHGDRTPDRDLDLVRQAAARRAA